MTIEGMQTLWRRKSRKLKKPMKRWVKWLIYLSLALFILMLAILGTGYWYIKSISLDDIKSRHQVTSDVSVTTAEPVKIPKIMEGAVDKAASLVGKDIEGQDALDVAAILLNSGLSLKDIRYLQGNAAYDLTVDEKQRIRDLLLEKLTPEEIELLRSITSKYGKYLSILNADYPIEWVGERDLALIEEHGRMWKEMEAKKAAASGDDAVVSSAKDVNTSSDKIAENSSGQKPLTDNQTAAKRKIDAKYDNKLFALHTTCSAKSNSLLQAIQKDLEADKDISLSKLQAKFLGQLADAESSCDRQFDQLIEQAKADYEAAGIPAFALPDWETDYNKAKSDARANGIAAITSKLNMK